MSDSETTERKEASGRESAVPEAEAREGYKWIQLGPKSLEVPQEWEKAKIREITETVTRGKQPTYVDKPGVPVLNQSCIYWDGFHEDEIRFLEEKVADDWKDKHFAQDGDVLVNSTGEGTLGRALYWDGPTGEYAIDSHITRLSLDGNVDPRFVRYYLESAHGQQMLFVFCVAGSTGQIELSKTDLLSMPVILPPLSQQRYIAEVLSTVDKKIRQTREVIRKAKELKAGLMQDLLQRGIDHSQYQEMRIGPKSSTIPQDWDVVRLKDIAKIESGSTPKRGRDEYWKGGTIPWVKSGEFNDRVIKDIEEKITEKAIEETGCEVFPEGTLLIALYGKGTVSKTARLGIDAATNQAIAGLLPRNGSFDPRYLQYYLINSRNTLLNVTVNPSSDTGRTNIYLSALRSFKVSLPPIEEQKQIADRISAVDEKIAEEKSQKEKLTELKRGLMQDLLTGEVRVNPDNIDI